MYNMLNSPLKPLQLLKNVSQNSSLLCEMCVVALPHLNHVLRSTGNHFGLADFQRNNYLRWTAMGKGVSKDLQILTRSRLERILIDVMRGS